MRYRDTRFPCDTDLTAQIGEKGVPAQLVNVSVTGARIVGLPRLPRDTLVTLVYTNAWITARVVWSNERMAGLRFPLPLSNTTLSALRGLGRAGLGGGLAEAHHSFRELA